MNRFFCFIDGQNVLLKDDDIHHLKNVLRIKEGEIIQLVSQNSDLFEAEISLLNPLKITILREITNDSELPSSLIIGFALLKGGHDELVLQKCTELGVSEFVPFISERTIIRLGEKEKTKKKERFEKIVLGAASQSKRLIVPKIEKIYSFKEALEVKAEHRYIAFEDLSSEKNNLLSLLEVIKKEEKAFFLIGPEGGFSKKEVEVAKEKGFLPISLGKRILRAETASIFISSVFSAEMEQ